MNNCYVLYSTSLISCPVDSGPKSLPTRWRNSWIAPTGFGYLPHLHLPSHQTASLSLFTDKPWVGLSGLKGARTLSYVSLFLHHVHLFTILSCHLVQGAHHHNKAPAKLRTLNYTERRGYIRCIVKEIIHDPGR